MLATYVGISSLWARQVFSQLNQAEQVNNLLTSCVVVVVVVVVVEEEEVAIVVVVVLVAQITAAQATEKYYTQLVSLRRYVGTASS